MRVVVPFVAGMLRDETLAALDAHAPGYQLAELDRADDLGYWRLVRGEWAKPGDLVIIEQDIEIRAHTLPDFRRCGEPVCSARYVGPPGSPSAGYAGEHGFGCTRIRAEVKARHPGVPDAAGPTPWQRLDWELGVQLMRRGYQLHGHRAVTHHHLVTPEDPVAWERWVASHNPDGAPAALGRAVLEQRLRALGLPGTVSGWLTIADNAAETMARSGLGPTDCAIALFDSAARPSWEQAKGFVDAVIDCLCPEVRNLPDIHMVDRDVTVWEARQRRHVRVRVEVFTPGGQRIEGRS